MSQAEEKKLYAVCWACERFEEWPLEARGAFYLLPNLLCRKCFGSCMIGTCKPDFEPPTTAPSAPDAAADRTGAPGSPQAEPEYAADKT